MGTDTWAEWQCEHQVAIACSGQRQKIWPQTELGLDPGCEHSPGNSSQFMLVSLCGAHTLLTQRVILKIKLNNE